ncbi:MAG TPA: saccharopine dehydrogenase C-terminal domain-containing protein [Crocinitomicaceae bacterium]|nr:saccharopine dehydrogenase C-terminal domain-containing protein [Crocinitomicaceae bacterium]
MQTILVLGAGFSSNTLLHYLSDNAEKHDWQIHVVDQNFENLKQKVRDLKRTTPLNLDALNKRSRRNQIKKADIVISMLPARFHAEVAEDCVDLKKDLITPSYVSKELEKLHDKAVSTGICIMNEIGVDPGIDHMSACKILDELRAKNAEITSFKSFCGGLIAPEYDNNPWNYKFTWNPRNVVVAGQGSAAQFIEQNQYKYIPYGQLFRRVETMTIDGYGDFEGYANRDSLKYRKIYHLDNIPTIYRGTLRRMGYAAAWDIFVQLGLTDDSFAMENSELLTPRMFLNAFLPYKEEDTVEHKLKKYFTKENKDAYQKIEWLGFFDDSKPIGVKNASPAQLLEKILVDKWKLSPDDKDMLVMYHEFEYELNKKTHRRTSSMVHIGTDQSRTAMANTVGLPIAICAKLMLAKKINLKGVYRPILKEVYEPILEELKEFNIDFSEVDEVIS